MKRWKWLALVALTAVLDQITKRLFEHADSVLIPGVLAFRGVRNTGAAFSFLAHQPMTVAALSVILFFALLYAAFRVREDKPLAAALALAAGGAMGNLIDRLLRGYVVDFIETLFIVFPVFNVADMAVTLGAVWAAGLILFRKEDKA